MKDKRRNERLSLSDIDLRVDGSSYKIDNISANGFSFFITDPSDFKVGDILSPINLDYNDKKESLTGKVVHITSVPKKEKEMDAWIVGLKFLFSEDDRDYYLKQFTDIMENIK